MTEPDYTVTDDRGRVLAVDLKTRGQTPGPAWQATRPDTHPSDLFVLDELTVRKLVEHASPRLPDRRRPRRHLPTVGSLLGPGSGDRSLMLEESRRTREPKGL